MKRFMQKNISMVAIIFLFCYMANAQELDSDLSISVVEQEYIQNYIYIKLAIVNHKSHAIFVLTNYMIKKITIENGILLFLDPYWPPKYYPQMDYFPLSVFHIPANQEIRSEQMVYVTILLNFENAERLNANKFITVDGLKYLNDDFSFFKDNVFESVHDYKTIYDQILKYIMPIMPITGESNNTWNIDPEVVN
jgi:hypothetical protein